ncbi:MAG: phosphotransferase, partial [Nitriliruptoraceae bacterium]|nr:phosphotransferase [Nitriliruptoraceae bacterium]
AAPAAPAVCHGDIGHANVAFDASGAAGLFDWEFVTQGADLDDLAEAAAMLVPLLDRDLTHRGLPHPLDHRARLAALATGAGVAPETILAHLPVLLERMTARVERFGAAGIPPWDGFLAGDQPGVLAAIRDVADRLLTS